MSKKKIYCSLRRREVIDTPEERVRQMVVAYLLEQAGYPMESFVIECALHQLPGVNQKEGMPNRRVDLAVYAPKKDQLKPLLLIECKAVPLTEAAVRQLIGYNHFIGAPFLALVNQSELKVFSGNQHFRRFPTYEEAFAAV